jgi:hypothetical protein
MARGQPLGGSVAAIHHEVFFCSNTSGILCPLHSIVPIGNRIRSRFKDIDVSLIRACMIDFIRNRSSGLLIQPLSW